MSRETEQSKQAELEIATCLARKWDFDISKMPTYASVDFEASRDDVICGYIECKDRDFPHDRYLTAYTKAVQFARQLEMAAAHQVPIIIANRYTDDVILYYRIDPDQLDPEFKQASTSTTRGELQTVVEIPIGKMERVVYIDPKVTTP